MRKTYFISGIDTGIGKTLATGLMLKHLVSRGIDAITVKLVQTGNVGRSEDIEAHRRIAGGISLPEDGEGLTAPQVFAYPASPLLAAAREGREVDLGRIADAVRQCEGRREVVLVESAGGLLVPLARNVLSADFAAARGWPLVLVTCGRLGAINHTLLSLEAAAARRLPLAGVVYNDFPETEAPLAEDAKAAIMERLAAAGRPRAFAEIPVFNQAGPFPDIDFSEIFL